jgi:hypothetical protein
MAAPLICISLMPKNPVAETEKANDATHKAAQIDNDASFGND